MVETEGDTTVVSLHCNAGTSDKVYHMVIEPGAVPGTYDLTAHHGPRTSAKLRTTSYFANASGHQVHEKFRTLLDEKYGKRYRDVPVNGPAKEALTRAKARKAAAATAAAHAGVKTAAAMMPSFNGWENDYADASEYFSSTGAVSFDFFSPALLLFSELSLALPGGLAEAKAYLQQDVMKLCSSGLLTEEVREWLAGLDSTVLTNGWRELKSAAASF